MTEWFASADVTDFTNLSAGSFAFDQSLSTVELAKRPFTVTRTVGSIWVKSDQVAALEFPFGAIGMQVVSEKAAATGVTALPDPITQEASDEWFTYRAFAVGGGTVSGAPVMEYAFDSRGQRKVQDGEDLAVMVTNASATDGVLYVLKFRILVRLS